MEIRPPKNKKEWEEYFLLRYEVLRKPWNQPKGSEQNDGDATGKHYAIWDNNKPVAIARVDTLENTHSVQVRFVAVATQKQGRGLGRKIMGVIEEECKNQSITSILLHARERAVPFYSSLNYKIVEKSHLLFNEIQHFLMKKEL